jgi:nucleoside-diphosphate-sugar epimerase
VTAYVSFLENNMASAENESIAPLALVVGATGNIGHAVASAFLARGWRVRALHRDVKAALEQDGRTVIEWVQGDAMHREDVIRAAQGASVVFHGVNPRRYHRWDQLAEPMLENSIQAACASGARLLFPGSLYNFGPDAGARVNERSPQNPITKKGRIRVAMEQRLRQAAEQEGLRVLIVRAGDFFGSRSESSWFCSVMVKPDRPLSHVVYPGKPEAGHSWAYLPDLGQTFVDLAEMHESLPAFDEFHFGGHWLEVGIEMAKAIRKAAKRPEVPIRTFPWFFVALARPFSELMREIHEMRYLWNVPIRPDNAKLVATLGREPHTRLSLAVTATLELLNVDGPDARSGLREPRPVNGKI